MKFYRLHFLLLSILALTCILFASAAIAQWSTNPAVNNAICTNYYNQNQIQMVSDGSGGAIIAWVDYRTQPLYTIFAQRINSGGVIQWTADGVQVSSSSVNDLRPSIIADGGGGAIITWVSNGDFGNLYAQRIDSIGTQLWAANGVRVCSTTVSNQSIPSLVSDGYGGGVIAWSDSRNNGVTGGDGVYAQRIDASGAIQWIVNGVEVADTNLYQGASLQAASDGNGGAIIVWEDNRAVTISELYTQKINGLGVTLWETNGVLINSVTGGSLYPQLIGDAGGAIICWVDRRNGNTDWNIYAQKISAGGIVQWTTNGLAICLAASNQNSPVLASDGNGGAIITWNEQGTGIPDPNIYAQRVNAGGTVQWAANGVGVCLATGLQGFPQLTSAGNGGAVITWQDSRTNNTPDIYAQKIDSTGASIWTTDGVAVSTATFVQSFPIIIDDGTNGMIVAWTDYRNDLGSQRNDIYAQRVRADGSLGGLTGIDDEHSQVTTFTLSPNYPNPFNAQTMIQYSLPMQSNVSIDIFDILGRKIETLVEGVKHAGNHQAIWDASNQVSGIYFYSIKAGDRIETKKMTLLK